MKGKLKKYFVVNPQFLDRSSKSTMFSRYAIKIIQHKTLSDQLKLKLMSRIMKKFLPLNTEPTRAGSNGNMHVQQPIAQKEIKKVRHADVHTSTDKVRTMTASAQTDPYVDILQRSREDTFESTGGDDSGEADDVIVIDSDSDLKNDEDFDNYIFQLAAKETKHGNVSMLKRLPDRNNKNDAIRTFYDEADNSVIGVDVEDAAQSFNESLIGSPRITRHSVVPRTKYKPKKRRTQANNWTNL